MSQVCAPSGMERAGVTPAVTPTADRGGFSVIAHIAKTEREGLCGAPIIGIEPAGFDWEKCWMCAALEHEPDVA